VEGGDKRVREEKEGWGGVKGEGGIKGEEGGEVKAPFYGS